MTDQGIGYICIAAAFIVFIVCGASVLLGRWPWQKGD